MWIFKNKNVKYFESPNTVHHENHDFSENKKGLAIQKPFENKSENLKFVCVSTKNTPTMLHQKV